MLSSSTSLPGDVWAARRAAHCACQLGVNQPSTHPSQQLCSQGLVASVSLAVQQVFGFFGAGRAPALLPLAGCGGSAGNGASWCHPGLALDPEEKVWVSGWCLCIFFVVRAGICVVCTPQEHRAAGEVLKLLYPRTASLSCSQAPPLMSRQELGRVVPSAGVGARGERNRCCVIRDGGEGERNPKFLAGTATPGTGSAKALTDPALSGKQGAAVREPCLNHAWFNQVNCFMGL